MADKLSELADLLPEPLRERCWKLMDDNRALFETAPGSTNNHQAWPGGYIDHIRETISISFYMYTHIFPSRELPFTMNDAIAVLFLHDLEKPWRIGIDENGKYVSLFPKKESEAFRERVMKEAGVWDLLTDEQREALKWVEGEHNSYAQNKRTMSELAAFCHCCDVMSARIWFNYPEK